MKNKRALKIGTYSVTVAVIVTAVVVALNLFVGQLPSSFLRPDFSKEKLTTIGKESEKILKKVNEKITIYYIVSDGKEDSSIYGLAERYADANSKIKIKKVDPITSPDFTKKYTEATLSDNSIIVESKKRSSVVDGQDFNLWEIEGYEGTYYTYAEYYQMAQQMYSYYGQAPEAKEYFFGENKITGAIDYVISDDIPVIYALDGHGETDISSRQFGTLVKDENIEIKSLSLAAGDKIQVPNDAAAVLINAPTTDINEAEKDALTDYLENGGKMLLFTNYSFAKKEDAPNLAAVCAKMGLKANSGIVADSNESKYFQYPYNIIPTVTSNGLASKMTEKNVYMFMPASHGIEPTGDAASFEQYSLLETSDGGYEFTEENYKDIASAEKMTYSLAYQSDNEKGGQLVWFGSPFFIDDSFVSYGNAKLFLAVIDGMVEKTTSVSIIGKTMTTYNLTVTDADTTMWTAIFAVIPAAVAIIGVAVFIKRRRK